MAIFLFANIRYPYLLTVSLNLREEVEDHANDTFFCKQQLKTQKIQILYFIIKEREKRFLRVLFFSF